MASTSGRISGIGLLALACGGCQLVSGLNKLETGSGGAGGSGGTIGTSVTTGNATSSSTHATATGTSSTTSKGTGTPASTTTTTTTATTSTSTGSGLVPCGGATDTLATLNGNTWQSSNALSQGAEVQISASAAMPGFIKLQAPGSYDECYVTIELSNVQAQTTAWAGIVDTNNPAVNFTEIGYSQSNQTITTNTDGSTTSATNLFNVQHLGLALHAGSVYFLHVQGAGSAWVLDGSVARPSWLNGTADTAEILVNATTAGTRAVYVRNFNIKPIALSDLP